MFLLVLEREISICHLLKPTTWVCTQTGNQTYPPFRIWDNAPNSWAIPARAIVIYFLKHLIKTRLVFPKRSTTKNFLHFSIQTLAFFLCLHIIFKSSANLKSRTYPVFLLDLSIFENLYSFRKENPTLDAD